MKGKTNYKNVRYLPFEIFFILDKKQKFLVVNGSRTLVFMLFLILKKGAKLFNKCRISDKSYNSYKRFSFFLKKYLKILIKFLHKSEIDKTRLEELGATNIEVIGNIKPAKLLKKN